MNQYVTILNAYRCQQTRGDEQSLRLGGDLQHRGELQEDVQLGVDQEQRGERVQEV